MIKKINRKIIIIIIAIIIAIIIVNFNIRNNRYLGSVIKNLKAETMSSLSSSEPEIDYDVFSVNGTKAKILVKITDDINGIKKVEYPDGFVVNCEGDQKRTTFAVDYEAELAKEYIFKVTDGRGVETDKKIVIINNYTVSISDITQTGFKVNIEGLTADEKACIEDIKYYVNDSTSETYYQNGETVTGLSERTSKYVWTEIIYNSGCKKRSINYCHVYTAHTHSDSFGCFAPVACDIKYELSRDFTYEQAFTNWRWLFGPYMFKLW